MLEIPVNSPENPLKLDPIIYPLLTQPLALPDLSHASSYIHCLALLIPIHPLTLPAFFLTSTYTALTSLTHSLTLSKLKQKTLQFSYTFFLQILHTLPVVSRVGSHKISPYCWSLHPMFDAEIPSEISLRPPHPPSLLAPRVARRPAARVAARGRHSRRPHLDESIGS